MYEIMNTPENSIPRDLLDKAVCVGIVPGQKKLAFIFGASYGKGVLVCRRGGDGPLAPTFHDCRARCQLWVSVGRIGDGLGFCGDEPRRDAQTPQEQNGTGCGCLSGCRAGGTDSICLH